MISMGARLRRGLKTLGLRTSRQRSTRSSSRLGVAPVCLGCLPTLFFLYFFCLFCLLVYLSLYPSCLSVPSARLSAHLYSTFVHPFGEAAQRLGYAQSIHLAFTQPPPPITISDAAHPTIDRPCSACSEGAPRGTSLPQSRRAAVVAHIFSGALIAAQRIGESLSEMRRHRER